MGRYWRTSNAIADQLGSSRASWCLFRDQIGKLVECDRGIMHRNQISMLNRETD